jgi:2-keto-myo-inositol isomerase
MSGLKFCCEAGDVIGCHRVVIVPTFDVGDKTISEIRDETVRVIHKMADYAEPHGMTLAFEFVGYPNCSVNTFGQAYDIVKTVNRDSVGVVLDCFHFHAMGFPL